MHVLSQSVTRFSTDTIAYMRFDQREYLFAFQFFHGEFNYYSVYAAIAELDKKQRREERRRAASKRREMREEREGKRADKGRER